jgi:hypothetical protein
VSGDEGSPLSLSESWVIWSSLIGSSGSCRIELKFRTWEVRRAALELEGSTKLECVVCPQARLRGNRPVVKVEVSLTLVTVSVILLGM